MKKIICIIFSAMVTPAMAGDIAVSLNTSIAGYSYEDSDGKTETDSFAIPLTISVDYQLDRDNKLAASFRAFDESIKAKKAGDLGASLDVTQIEVSWLRQKRFSRHFKPYFGVGLRTSQVEATNKYTLDSSGIFLERTFPNTDESTLSGVLTANADWEISRDAWYIDSRFNYDIPIGDGFEGYALSAGIKRVF